MQLDFFRLNFTSIIEPLILSIIRTEINYYFLVILKPNPAVASTTKYVYKKVLLISKHKQIAIKLKFSDMYKLVRGVIWDGLHLGCKYSEWDININQAFLTDHEFTNIDRNCKKNSMSGSFMALVREDIGSNDKLNFRCQMGII